MDTLRLYLLLGMFSLAACDAGSDAGHYLLQDTITNANKTLYIGVVLPFSYVDKAFPATAFIARREIRRLHLLDDYNIILRFGDSNCHGPTAMKAAIRLRTSDEGLDALLGDACSSACEPTGLLTAAWNIPQVSYRCTDVMFSDKTVYPTFTSVLGSNLLYTAVFTSVMKHFGWDRAVIITGVGTNTNSLAVDLQSALQAEKMKVMYYTLDFIYFGGKVHPDRLDLEQKVIRETKTETRVYILLVQLL